MIRFPETPIRELQQMLRIVFPDTTLNVDGIFGPETQRDVRRFQCEFHLPVTGVVDEATWTALHGEYTRANVLASEAEPLRPIFQPYQVLSIGSENVHLYVVQAVIKALARYYETIPTVAVTGVLDAKTAEAVRRFQACCGLPVTGAVDKLTWQGLAKQYRLVVGDGTGQFPTRRTE